MSSDHKKRALFLFPTDTMGGAENVTRMTAEAAARSGAFDEVILFFMSGTPSGSVDHLAGRERLRLVHTCAADEKTGLFHLLRILSKGRFDLVFSSHTHLNAAASLMRRAGALKTARLVTRESTLIFERDLGLRGKLAQRLYRLYGGQDMIICQNDRMAASLHDNTNERFAKITRTIANPVDLQAIEKAKSATDPLAGLKGKDIRKLVWCGRLAPVKSPLRAVDTLSSLHASGQQDWHLVMIGDGPMRTEIEDHAAHLGLADHVTMTGRVNAPSSIMRHCDAGLLTSDLEGYPNVIPEMLASGVPFVVTTDCAGGLSQLPGVAIAGAKTGDALAEALAVAQSCVIDKGEVVSVLEARSPSAFFNQVMAA